MLTVGFCCPFPQSFIKHNATFHKLFPDIPESEDLLHGKLSKTKKALNDTELFDCRWFIVTHSAYIVSKS